MINQSTIDKAISYDEYLKILEKLVDEGKTSGTDQSKELIDYTKLNFQRMKRLNKTIELNEKLKSAITKCEQPMIWLVLTEAWCGDAAQNIPLIDQIAQQKECVSLKLLFRDENLDVMDQFLTNGGRSIPKLIALRKSDLKLLGDWGPRPEAAQAVVADLKSKNLSHEEWVKEVQIWYNEDKGESQQKEMAEAIEKWQIESNK